MNQPSGTQNSSHFDKVAHSATIFADQDEELPKQEQKMKEKQKCLAFITLKGILILIAFILILCLTAGVVNALISVKTVYNLTFDNVEFNFFFYCPASYAINKIAAYSPNSAEYLKYVKNFKTELNKTYIVSTMTGYQLTTNSSNTTFTEMRIRYCGLARLFNETCDQARFICSNPGPAFDVPSYQDITVFWINNYTKPNQTEVKSSVQNSMDLVSGYSVNFCFNRFSTGATELCNKTGKPRQYETISAFDPTNKVPTGFSCSSTVPPSDFTNSVLSCREAMPHSPHIHGLEVEPYWDGNPQSWWDNNGSIGVGFLALNDTNYNYLQNDTFKKLLAEIGITGPNKTNIYKNVQSPGTLWYHDHSMGVTAFNVKVGLHSFYIIRNQTIQASLPSGKYEKLIYMYTGIASQSLSTSCQTPCANPSSIDCSACLANPGSITALQQDPLQYNTTYRFRILNGDFFNFFQNLQFVYVTCPLNSTQCYKNVPFTVIGTDSTLRQKGVPNQQSITMSPGERIDALVNIDINATSIGVNDTLYVVANKIDGMNDYFYGQTLLASFSITPNFGGNKMNISNITLNTSFVNLSTVSQSNIAVRRMRPFIVATEAPAQYGINGHVRFGKGASENPKIGTIQDWYMINPMGVNHAVHIHLIQYQVIQYVSLKSQTFLYTDSNSVTQNISCTYYWMDFVKKQALSDLSLNNTNSILQSMVTFTQNFTNAPAFCYFLLNNMTATGLTQFFSTFKNEDQVDSTNTSGLDVQSKCASSSQCLNYGQVATSTNLYKYIVAKPNPIADYLRGWKQVYLIPRGSYVKLRVRWTRADFPLEMMNPLDPGNNLQGCQQKYFYIEQAQITKFPGYVYHCHILKHQDKEMMRPIMVQPSGCDQTLEGWRTRWQNQYCSYLQALTGP